MTNNISFSVVIVLAVLIYGCKEPTALQEKQEFRVPAIVNSQFPDTLPSIQYEAESISEVFPIFAGKYAFQDQIDLNEDLRRRDTTLLKEFIREYWRTEVDDSVDVNGFEVVVDYETTINYPKHYGLLSTLYQYYPVYFVNTTRSDKLFFGKDSHGFGIQEALDSEETGRWKPIEAEGFDFCGNGSWGLIVHPNEFVILLYRKYKGDVETEMRIRAKIGETIYVSRPFYGRIKTKQFRLKDNSTLKTILQEANGQATSWLFYGAWVPDIEY